MARFFASHGVTAYLPTTWSAPLKNILNALHTIATCPQPTDGAHHLGVHVEGPYINPDFKGAQRIEVIRRPDPEEYKDWFELGVVRIVTIAPEIDGAHSFIDSAIHNGIEIAIGHSGADYNEVIKAVNHGVRQVTHIFNGMPGLHHRNPGTLGGCLVDDRLYAQIICDGVHIHPQVVKLAIRVKTPARVILITDAICGAGLPNGEYESGGQIMRVKDGVSRTSEGGLSGSTLTMDKALRNTMNFTGFPLSEVLPMATSVPAEAMGWIGKKGVISPGADADIVIFNSAFEVCQTMISGQIVYERK